MKGCIYKMPIKTIMMILFCIGIIILQINLSKKENKWLGFVLPGITFIFSLLTVLGEAVFIGQKFYIVLLNLLQCNIPTAILLLIYVFCRNKNMILKK
ncbi:hypothetical protein [Clostridium botulinum]|uniref:hypothetical protein n=2 Tax=Clostridium TaxID=1485 RepID=UPI001966FBEB|nr:hypothetical protein [Clostridium botulinum]